MSDIHFEVTDSKLRGLRIAASGRVGEVKRGGTDERPSLIERVVGADRAALLAIVVSLIGAVASAIGATLAILDILRRKTNPVK